MYSAFIKFNDCPEWVHLSVTDDTGIRMLAVDSLNEAEETVDELLEFMKINKANCEIVFIRFDFENKVFGTIFEDDILPVDENGIVNTISLDEYRIYKNTSVTKH